jgi:hypothetical protein
MLASHKLGGGSKITNAIPEKRRLDPATVAPWFMSVLLFVTSLKNA